MERVRVAVIDTGIDSTNPWIAKRWSRCESISKDRGYRDFLQDEAISDSLKPQWEGNYDTESIKTRLRLIENREEDEPDDTSGHGTHMAGILLQLVPFATLFVARVLREQDVELQYVGSAARRVALVSVVLRYPNLHQQVETSAMG